MMSATKRKSSGMPMRIRIIRLQPAPNQRSATCDEGVASLVNHLSLADVVSHGTCEAIGDGFDLHWPVLILADLVGPQLAVWTPAACARRVIDHPAVATHFLSTAHCSSPRPVPKAMINYCRTDYFY